jgi:hypothetical protein
MILDLEANEVEVKVLTSLASVTEITGHGPFQDRRSLHNIQELS